ncbi:hypothetical protein DFR52_10494 [Hoeflea marina]|uniref:Uncharacterized protein n=1 Tax=Hoeflea marina TaxID=274592 RepID=A0A317PFG7_9HYPH|nr:hypothetical protein [Hoeflea marina]PWV98805.1 hypothetical protein DFR52_10494 [Hoeflea marina]
MVYLMSQMWIWLLIAFVIGGYIGWTSAAPEAHRVNSRDVP